MFFLNCDSKHLLKLCLGLVYGCYGPTYPPWGAMKSKDLKTEQIATYSATLDKQTHIKSQIAP